MPATNRPADRVSGTTWLSSVPGATNREAIDVAGVELVDDGQCCSTAEGVTAMCLATWLACEAALVALAPARCSHQHREPCPCRNHPQHTHRRMKSAVPATSSSVKMLHRSATASTV